MKIGTNLKWKNIKKRKKYKSDKTEGGKYKCILSFTIFF